LGFISTPIPRTNHEQPLRAVSHSTFAPVIAVAVALTLTLSISTTSMARAATPTHKVVSGDTLGGIAKRYRCTSKEIRRKNRLRSDLIRVGQSLRIPKRCVSASAKAAEGQLPVVQHIVLRGDTLGALAERYGVTVKHITSMNRALRRKKTLRVGQKLRIQPTKPVKRRHRFKYKIESGDTLSGIAKKHDLKMADIRGLNPRKKTRRLRIGDTIWLYRDGPENPSVSLGRPQHGNLVNGEQLPAGSGWYRRRPVRSWGTNHMIDALTQAFQTVQRKHPKAHDNAVGDLSARNGGKLANHISHQTGRDADISFYFRGHPKKGPKAFLSAKRHPLDFAANWTLIEALVGPKPDKGPTEYMFVDYAVQSKLYNWAKSKGVSKRRLAQIFQYPRGRRAMRGIIRHEPGHHNHYHVRFRCPPRDRSCK
jgi:LysM repeat protein/murein endopeptidase